MTSPDTRALRRLIGAGVVLGVGMGAFIDGILFHQLLQIHNMISARRPPQTVENIEINMVWDGLFHALAWFVTLAGIALLFRAGRFPERPWDSRTLAGSMLVGWGLFNLVEGVINHHVLHLHHVVERYGLSPFDWAFLGFGVALVAAGVWLIASARRRTAPAPRAPVPPRPTTVQ